MRVILDVLEGPRKGRSFVFDRHDTFIVGRSRFVHCPMPEDEALSRDHFLIELNPPDCELRDLDSTNGTYVNDQRVGSRVKLKSGDMIAAGTSVFAVRVEEGVGDSGTNLIAETVAVLPPSATTACAGCGTRAPAGSSGSSAGAWFCDLCRGDVETSPQPVPHYTVIRELGRGGMGVVFQARNNDTGKMVALKLIVPESAANRTSVDRFLREMSVMSELKHPNIVEWYEQGMTRGQFWFTMEYVAGTNLEALATASPGHYPIAQACRMASQVLKGLDHAHARGFVHRDIKPENILIGRMPDGLVAKISDFGLAKSYRGLGLSALTFSGEMRGTIPFMPPEQMLDFKTVLPSGDLYATAATLYFLIAGHYIYDESSDGSDPIRLLLEEKPVPIRKRRPDVPLALEAVLEKGLARNPEDRYPTAAALRQAIRPFC